MNLYHLGYFAVLAQTEHYGKAAEILGITQPSLSHAISAMEAEIGVTLFEKSGRNVVLNRFGRQFLLPVTKALDTLNEGIQDLKEIQNGGGAIEIGCLPSLGVSRVPQLISEFLNCTDNSQIQIHLHTGSSRQLLDGIGKGTYDVVFCHTKTGCEDIHFVPFAKERLALIVPDGHPLAKFDTVHLEKALLYPFITFAAGTPMRAISDSMFQQIEGHPTYVMEIEEAQVIAGMVANGFGIAMVPETPLLSSLPLKTLSISYPHFERLTYTALRSSKYRSPAAEAFCEYCTKAGRIIT